MTSTQAFLSFTVSALAVSWLALQPAQATLSISGSVGGAPTGVTLDNLDSLIVGGASPQTTATGIHISFDPDAAVVQGSLSGIYAAPFLSGGNGTGFGSPNQPNGADTTPYLTSGSTGSFSGAQMTLTLPAEEKYFGLLWGSVDAFNTLQFFDGATLVGTVTGSDVTASPNGDQGVNGTLYVNINSTLQFDKIVATSSQHAFEFDNLAYNPTPVVPEPASLALFASALTGLGLFRRRRNRA
jgi:hypothetical protein